LQLLGRGKKSLECVIDSSITLSGLTLDDMNKVMESTTFPNPVYANVQKFSKYAYTNVPPYLRYYKVVEDSIVVPMGYDLTKLKENYSVSITDNRIAPKALDFGAVNFSLKLRESQQEAVQNFFEMNKLPFIHGSIQMPTGKGKSILALYIAYKLGLSTLIIVHKNDLVKGWNDDIKLAFGNNVTTGLIKAKKNVTGNFITIATIQTLNRLSCEELEKIYNTFGLVITDEMHHIAASSFNLISNFRARYRLGLSATPERNDGLTHVMSLYMGGFCYNYKHTESEEDITKVEVTIRKSSLYYVPVCEQKNGKWRVVGNLQKNSELSDNQKRISEIPFNIRPRVSFQTFDDYAVKNSIALVCSDIYNEFNSGHSCLVFFTKKEHIVLYQRVLSSDYGISTDKIELLFGDNLNCDDVLIRAENERQLVTLATYAKATEGTNVRQWEVAFLVSSINNGKNVEQAVGRIRRVKEHKLNIARLYDYRHPSIYTLSSHGATRDTRYKQLHFLFNSQTQVFSRGFKN